MKLSLCMIVKNEEENLRRALDSVVDVVDEIVIVDTGSTDGTPSIAKEYSDIYEEIEWEGFSHARNVSMNLATGDYILILDGDEYISMGHDAIRTAADQDDLICGMIPVTNTVQSGPVLGERLSQIRIVKNVPEIRWKYAVHNQIEDQVHAYAKKHMRLTGQAGILADVHAEITHTGYDLTPDRVLEKYSPRLAFLRQEITRAVADDNMHEASYYRFQLALMLHMVFSMDEALEAWEDVDFELLNGINRWYAHFIASRAYLMVGDLDKALMHCNGMYAAQCIPGQRIASEPASHMITGVVYIERGERELGLMYLIQAFLDNMVAPRGVRCILNNKQILHDIAKQCDESTFKDMATMANKDDLPALVRYVRDMQRELVELPEDVLEEISGVTT